MSFAKLLFSMVNRAEAKLARLRCASRLINGLEVFYHSNTKHFNNDKPVLVLLHGFSADKYVWNRFARRFASQYYLLIPDLKGHGETAYDPTHEYSVNAQCKMLLALLDQLQIDRFYLVGNSMGGLIAAKFINDVPQRVKKCVLIDPAGARSQYVQSLVDQGFNPFKHEVEQDFFDFYNLIMAKPPYVPKFLLRSMAREYINKSEQYTNMFRQFYNLRDFYPSDHRFDYPHAMLIWGLNDKLLPVEDYTQWKTMLNANTHVYEDLGHLPMVEDVKRVSTDILRFLKGTSNLAQ